MLKKLIGVIFIGLYLWLSIWQPGSTVPIVKAQEATESAKESDQEETKDDEKKQEEDHTDELREIESTINELREKINASQQEQRSLASTIQVLNNRILLNEKEIEKTENEIRILELQIEDLSQRISGLELSLGELSQILLSRIQEQYKQSQVDPLTSLLASSGLAGFIREQRYIKRARAHTEDIMLATEVKRQVFDEQKAELEAKQNQIQVLRDQLESKHQALADQKAEKQVLLDQTKNSEIEYQRLLNQALAEYKAIEAALISGEKVGSVKKGEPIALIGNSGYPGCSTGAHLHFEVRKDNKWVDPTTYLKPRSLLDADKDQEITLGSGDWDWPIKDPMRLTQHYGKTPYSWRYKYSGGIHTGLDLTSSSAVITAPADGELYTSSQACGSSSVINIRYIDHGGGVVSFYLHVQ
jgi:peptidoglycan hydrolase CwlO-like protein